MKRTTYTESELAALMTEARNYVMTPEEREAQRRSFAFGSGTLHNPAVTRDLVDEVADEMTAAPAKRWVDSWWAVPVALLVLSAFLAGVYNVAPNGAREHVEAGK